jgi:hypothetical protein
MIMDASIENYRKMKALKMATTTLSWAKERAHGRLTQLIAEGCELSEKLNSNSALQDVDEIWGQWQSWSEGAVTALDAMFDSKTKGVASLLTQSPKDSFSASAKATIISTKFSGLTSLSCEEKKNLVFELKEEVREKTRKLSSIKNSLDDYCDMSSEPPCSNDLGDKIFIVHGRDEARKLEVQRFVENVTSRETVILADVAGRSQNLLEKLRIYLDESTFAVVIMTGDDEGYYKPEPDKVALRARQNVIFELGFCIAKLGQERVAVLYEEGVDIPSDFAGVVYTSLAGEWKISLAREMRAFGLHVDMNKSM